MPLAEAIQMWGLFFDVAGATVLALTEIPGLREKIGPRKLIQGRDTLWANDEISKGEIGFPELVDILEEKTGRINRDELQTIVFGAGGSDFGYSIVFHNSATNYEITRSDLLRIWIERKVDAWLGWHRRFPALLSIVLGFVLLGANFWLPFVQQLSV